MAVSFRVVVVQCTAVAALHNAGSCVRGDCVLLAVIIITDAERDAKTWRARLGNLTGLRWRSKDSNIPWTSYSFNPLRSAVFSNFCSNPAALISSVSVNHGAAFCYCNILTANYSTMYSYMVEYIHYTRYYVII